jgi:hypothetical protein
MMNNTAHFDDPAAVVETSLLECVPTACFDGKCSIEKVAYSILHAEDPPLMVYLLNVYAIW